MTYRVVQVAAPGGEGEQQAVVTTGNAFPQGQVAQVRRKIRPKKSCPLPISPPSLKSSVSLIAIGF